MKTIDFSDISELSEKAYTKPGVIDTFEIKSVEFKTSPVKGTYFARVTFERNEDGFSEDFYLSKKALPRLQSLISKAAGITLNDTVTEETIIELLVGKKVVLKTYFRTDENGKLYTCLPYRGFAKSVNDDEKELKYTNEELQQIEMALNANAVAAEKATTPSADDEDLDL